MKKAFDNVKNQIGFCGIWCGSCVVGNGALRELTRRYEEVVEKYGLKEWASKDFDFREFKKGLTSIQEVALCQGCLKDGGRTDCEIRSCARSRKIADCSICKDFRECQNAELLKTMRDGAHGAGLLVKDKDDDRQELREKGTDELKRRFPTCILLCNIS